MAERTLLQRFDQAGPLTWLLVAAAGWALLLWLAALLGMGGQVADAEPAASDAALPQPRPATPARPLFTQDRRPRSFLATAPEGDGAAQNQSLDFILTGVLISPQVQLAVVQPTGGGNPQRVRVGKSPEGAAGWRLVDVQPRRAVFEGASGQTALDLRNFGNPGSPPAAAAQPQSQQPQPAASRTVPVRVDPASAQQPQDQEARIEAIRKRIEARRAQLRAGQNGSSAPASSTQPPKP